MEQRHEQLAYLEQRLLDMDLPVEQHLELIGILNQHTHQAAEFIQQHQPYDEPYSAASPEEAEEIVNRAAAYRQRRFEPLYPGSSVSALEADVLLFGWRHEYSIKDRAMDALLKMLGGRILPSANQLPESLYMLRTQW